MRTVLAVAVALATVIPAPVAGAAQQAPYDYAYGTADERTGVLGGVMGRSRVPEETGYGSVQGGVVGGVGVLGDAPAGRVRAAAVVDVARAAALQPDAALCIRIAAPATADLPALPNNAEGGGPVCRFLPAGGSAVWEAQRFVAIQTFADLDAPRPVGAEVFVSWLTHPRETGGVASLGRVLSLELGPA